MFVAFALTLTLSQPISVNLQPLMDEVMIGDELRFKAPTINKTAHDILLVPQGDSMQEGRKAPLCQVQFRVKGTADWRIPRVEVDCGNTNLLRKNDFVKVAPGASIDLLGGMDWSVLALQHVSDQPGWYEFRLVYDTTAPLQRWLGGPVPDLEAERMAGEFKPFHDQVPIGRFVSSVALVRLIRRHDG